MISNVQRTQFRPRPFPAPYLDVAITLDEACPGHLSSALYGAGIKRQARFFAYGAIASGRAEEIADRLRAHEPDSAGESALRLLGRALISMRAQRIVEAVTGAPVPPGFLGALARLGHDPLSPDPGIYRTLWDMHADPRQRRRVKVLQQTSGQIGVSKIRTLSVLDDLLVRKTVVDRIFDHGSSVEALGRLLGLIRSQCSATDDDIAVSLDALPSAWPFEGFRKWAEKWTKRQVRTRCPPFSADDPDLVLRLGAGLIDLGARFRNCAKSVVTDSFIGSRLVYEWVGEGGPATLEMVPAELAGRAIWVCDDVRAPRNRDPSPEAVAAIRAKLARYGHAHRTRLLSSADQRALVSFVEPWDDRGIMRADDCSPVEQHEPERESFVA